MNEESLIMEKSIVLCKFALTMIATFMEVTYVFSAIAVG